VPAPAKIVVRLVLVKEDARGGKAFVQFVVPIESARLGGADILRARRTMAGGLRRAALLMRWKRVMRERVAAADTGRSAEAGPYTPNSERPTCESTRHRRELHDRDWGCLPVFIRTVPRSWLPSLVTRERHEERCSNWSAMVGSTSEISTPEALVLIGLELAAVVVARLEIPQIQVAGPPPIHRMMRLLFSFFSLVSAARRAVDELKPGTARADAPATWVRKCRLLIPASWFPPVDEGGLVAQECNLALGPSLN